MTQAELAAAPERRGGPVRLFLWYWLPVIAYVGFIFTASSIPGRTMPDLFPYMDKVEHMAEYGLFGLLLGRAFRFTVGGQRGRLWALGTVLLGALVGAADEWYQRSTPGRVSDIRDWATDVTALLVAVLITQYLKVHPLGRRPDVATADGGKEER